MLALELAIAIATPAIPSVLECDKTVFRLRARSSVYFPVRKFN